MSALKFSEEFSELIIRWTRPVTIKGEGGDTLMTPLSNQQLLNAMQSVVQVLLGVSLQIPDYSNVKTPAVGIAVCTPSAPVVPKNDLNRSSEMLDSGEKVEAMDVDVASFVAEDKKDSSRTSPSTNSVSRSGTFIREEEKRAALEKDEGDDDVFTKLETIISEENSKSYSILQKIKVLRDYAFHFISKIDDVEKEVQPQTTKPIRRLSSIGVFSAANRPSSIMRTVPSSKHRRSSKGFPGTPTSSKLNVPLAEKDDGPSRRKSTTAVSIYSKPTATLDSKKSPLSSIKAAKSAKFAHVQSTIPRPLMLKRKAQ